MEAATLSKESIYPGNFLQSF